MSVVAVLVAVAAILLFWVFSRPSSPLDTMRFQRVSTDGMATVAAISPDGKYVAHATRQNGQQVLVLVQAANGARTVVRPLDVVDYRGLLFSHDGRFIYYLQADREASAIYRVETLGGLPQRVVETVSALSGIVGTSMALSPDDARIAFTRVSSAGGPSTLFVASVDGGDERSIASVDPPARLGSIAWSPDGRTLAYSQTAAGASPTTIAAVHPDGGSVRTIAAVDGWTTVRGLAWMPDGQALLVVARSEAAGNTEQIWRLGFPGGDLRRVTNDLNAYAGASVSADGRSLVTLTMDFATEIWASAPDDFRRGRAIVSRTAAKEGLRGIAIAPDGHIVYEAEPNGDENIWTMQLDGGERHRLTADAKLNIQPSVCPDGRVVFSSNRSGLFAIWRIASDGGRPTELANFGVSPVCAPDGRWVAFAGREGTGPPNIWRVSIDGGDPLRLTERNAGRRARSPDGRRVACVLRRPSAPTQIALLPATGGEPQPILDLPSEEPIGMPSAAPLAWTRDGESLIYTVMQNGVSNVWRVSLVTRAATQLTEFTDRVVAKFAWSPDGKRLICTRVAPVNNVVLIRDFR